MYELPKIVNSKTFTNKLQTIIYEKTNVIISTEDFKLTTYPNLTFDIFAKRISATNKKYEKEIFVINDIYSNFYLKGIKPHTLCAKYIYFDKSEFDKIQKPEKNLKNKNIEINVEKLPYISIDKAKILIKTGEKNNTNIDLTKFNIIPYQKQLISDISLNINSNLLKETIKLDGQGQLIFNKNSLETDNFKIKSGIADFYISGKIFDNKKNYDVNIKSENLSVDILEKTFLTIMKLKNPEKNFIENFYDFGGLAKLNLQVKPKEINGICIIKDLSAKTVKFSIPIYIPKVNFVFNKDKVEAIAEGTFGEEKTETDFKAIDIFDLTRTVSGTVKASLGSNFARKYVPNTDITNKIDLLVKYVVKNKKPEVEYIAKIPIGSNVHYKTADLGLLDKARRVYAKTIKQGNNLYLDNYDYSFIFDENINHIIKGEGLFIKKDGKFQMDYITCQTEGDAPVSITGSFGRYIEGGTFNGNIRYNYPRKIITGKFNLKDSKYKDFYIKNATVIADDSTIEISSNGTLQKSPFTGYINMKNHFEDTITIYNIDLYLKKFILHKNKYPKTKIKLKIPPKTQDIKWIVEKGRIKLDELRFRKVLVENIELTGNIKDNLVNFAMPDINFANGKLSAQGVYNISNHSSDAYLTAKNIDSNLAADMILNLHEQVEGFANATAHVITKNKLEHIKAHATFEIKEGALTKIGSREFIIKKSKKFHHTIKFKLPDIINIDEKKIQSLKSNLKGSFDLYDDDIKNVEVYSQRKYLSTYTEGSYNIETQNSKIQVWGKYNKNAQKGIKILFVPLSMITKIIFRPEKTRNLYLDKINKIPNIEATPSQLEIFRVWFEGNLNDNSKLKIKMKSLK